MATKEGGGIRPTDRRPRRADERDIPDRLDENIVRTSCFGRGRPSHDITLLGRRTSTRKLFPPEFASVVWRIFRFPLPSPLSLVACLSPISSVGALGGKMGKKGGGEEPGLLWRKKTAKAAEASVCRAAAAAAAAAAAEVHGLGLPLPQSPFF